MQMRSGDATSGADLSDELTALDRIADRDEHAAQVMIDRHDTVAVMHKYRVTAVEEIAHERHHAAIRYAHGGALRSGNIQSIVTAAPDTVHLAPRAEHARDPRGAGTNERLTPQPRDFVGAQ